MIFDDQKRLELSNSVPDVVFDANYKAKYHEFLEYSQSEGEYLNWYTGISNINLPCIKDIDFMSYKLETASLTGSVSTPYFRKTFDENKFEKNIDWNFDILVPSNLTEGSNLVVDIEYDLALSSSSLVKLKWQSLLYFSYTEDTSVYLEKTKKSARMTYLASEYSAEGKK